MLGSLEVGDNLKLPWLNHPKFIRARDNALAQFHAKEYNFRKVKSVIFLCGGHGSPRRERIGLYLRKNHSGILTFHADEVWSLISALSDLNALEMEAELADLADMVLIVVESPGTFAELGAFSLSKELRTKLLPVIDTKYRLAESFVNTGPVRWIDKDSSFAPSLWTDYSRILEIAKELDERLTRLPKPTEARIPDLSLSPKHLLFFLCDLVAVFGPCPLRHVEYYVKKILGKQPKMSCTNLLPLAEAMGLIKAVTDAHGTKLYHRRLGDVELFSFRYTGYIDVASLRAQILGALLRIAPARNALETAGT